MNSHNVIKSAANAKTSGDHISWLVSPGDLVQEFLRQKRIAIVGVSRDKRHFSRSVFGEFIKRGYDVIPCNPHGDEIDGIKVVGNVGEIQPAVDGVIIMTPPAMTIHILRDCQAAGIKRIWLHRGAGSGSVTEEALRFCHDHNMKVVPGFCPLMFLSDTSFVHRIHRFFKRLNRTYPS